MLSVVGAAPGQPPRSRILSKHRVLFLTHRGGLGRIEGRTLNCTGVGLESGNTCPMHPFEKQNGGTCGGSMVQIRDGGVEATPEGLADPVKDGVFR